MMKPWILLGLLGGFSALGGDLNVSFGVLKEHPELTAQDAFKQFQPNPYRKTYDATGLKKRLDASADRMLKLVSLWAKLEFLYHEERRRVLPKAPSETWRDHFQGRISQGLSLLGYFIEGLYNSNRQVRATFGGRINVLSDEELIKKMKSNTTDHAIIPGGLYPQLKGDVTPIAYIGSDKIKSKRPEERFYFIVDRNLFNKSIRKMVTGWQSPRLTKYNRIKAALIPSTKMRAFLDALKGQPLAYLKHTSPRNAQYLKKIIIDAYPFRNSLRELALKAAEKMLKEKNIKLSLNELKTLFHTLFSKKHFIPACYQGATLAYRPLGNQRQWLMSFGDGDNCQRAAVMVLGEHELFTASYRGAGYQMVRIQERGYRRPMIVGPKNGAKSLNQLKTLIPNGGRGGLIIVSDLLKLYPVESSDNFQSLPTDSVSMSHFMEMNHNPESSTSIDDQEPLHYYMETNNDLWSNKMQKRMDF